MKEENNAQEIFVEASKVLYQEYLKNPKPTINKNDNTKINKDEKFQIVSFSTNESSKTPNDIINIFLGLQNHIILKKNRFTIAFSTLLNNMPNEKKNNDMLCFEFNKGIFWHYRC